MKILYDHKIFYLQNYGGVSNYFINLCDKLRLFHDAKIIAPIYINNYLQKFDKEMRENYILKQHPESNIHNYDEVYNLAVVQRNKENIIVDDLHKTIPILTKYEKTKIIGVRAQQLASGSKPLIDIPPGLTDIIEIAEREFHVKKTPYILKRLVGKRIEYWKIEDLEII